MLNSDASCQPFVFGDKIALCTGCCMEANLTIKYIKKKNAIPLGCREGTSQVRVYYRFSGEGWGEIQGDLPASMFP